MAHMPKPSKDSLSARPAGIADSQAKDWLSAEATPQESVSAGQGPTKGTFPVAPVFHHEELRGGLDKDGGAARHPPLPINVSRTLVTEFDMAAKDTPPGTPQGTAAQPTRPRGTLGRREQTPGRASRSSPVPGTSQEQISIHSSPQTIHSSPQTIHSSPQSDIRMIQQVVPMEVPRETAAQPTRSPGDPYFSGGDGGSADPIPEQPMHDSDFGASLEEVIDTIPIQDSSHEGRAAQPSRPREEEMTFHTSFDSQAETAAQPTRSASASFDSQTRPTAQPARPSSALPTLSTAQPMRHGREPTGETPIPRSKRQKDDDYDLNVSPLVEGFHRHPPGSAGGAPMVTPSVAPSKGPVPSCHTPPLATLDEEEEVAEESSHHIPPPARPDSTGLNTAMSPASAGGRRIPRSGPRSTS